jgi:hypothetical protein
MRRRRSGLTDPLDELKDLKFATVKNLRWKEEKNIK